MKTIESKPKSKPVHSELFFCKECGGPPKGTIYDIAINKIFCSIHQTEEVIDLSGEHSGRFPIFLMDMMHPELVWHGNNIAYICPQCGELHPSSVDCECEIGNEICKRCGSHVKTVNKEERIDIYGKDYVD